MYLSPARMLTGELSEAFFQPSADALGKLTEATRLPLASHTAPVVATLLAPAA